MDNFAKIVPYLDNPLAIIGFALFLLFGVHRLLIKSGILPPVAAADAPEIVKLLLRYGFYIAIAVLILGFIYAGMQTYLAATTLTGSLRVVETRINDETEKFPNIDISFRNDGKSVAAITRADIHIKNVWVAKSPFLPAARLVSWTYKAMLPITGSGCTITVPMAQDVASNGTDRIVVELGNDASPTYDRYIFHISIEFFYNESESSVATKDIIYIAGASQEWLAANVNYERRIEAQIYNYYVAQAVQQIQGAEIGGGAKTWLDEIANLPVEAAYAAKDQGHTIEERKNALQFLQRLGFTASDTLPILRQMETESVELNSETAATIQAISGSKAEAPSLAVERGDGHSGCEPAPLELRMKSSFPF